MEDIITMIGNFGFPIAVTAFLLIRIESRLSQLNDSIHELSSAIKNIK